MAVLAVGAAAYAGATFAGGAIAAYAGTIATVAMTAYSMWEQSKQVYKNEGPRLQELKLNASSYGAGLPFGYGTFSVAGQIIWMVDLKEVATTTESGGKGGPTVQSTAYSYYANFAIAVASNRVDYVRRIWADGKLVYDVSDDADNDIIVASQELAKKFKLYNGTEDQLPDPTIQSFEGVDNTPAYRGTAYIVFTDLDVTQWGRIPNLQFELVRGQKTKRLVSITLTNKSNGAAAAKTSSYMSAYNNGTFIYQGYIQLMNPTDPNGYLNENVKCYANAQGEYQASEFMGDGSPLGKQRLMGNSYDFARGVDYPIANLYPYSPPSGWTLQTYKPYLWRGKVCIPTSNGAKAGLSTPDGVHITGFYTDDDWLAQVGGKDFVICSGNNQRLYIYGEYNRHQNIMVDNGWAFGPDNKNSTRVISSVTTGNPTILHFNTAHQIAPNYLGKMQFIGDAGLVGSCSEFCDKVFLKQIPVISYDEFTITIDLDSTGWDTNGLHGRCGPYAYTSTTPIVGVGDDVMVTYHAQIRSNEYGRYRLIYIDNQLNVVDHRTYPNYSLIESFIIADNFGGNQMLPYYHQGIFFKSKGVLMELDSVAAGTEKLSDIVADILGFVDVSADVSALTDDVQGFVIQAPTTPRTALEPLMTTYLFDLREE